MINENNTSIKVDDSLITQIDEHVALKHVVVDAFNKEDKEADNQFIGIITTANGNKIDELFDVFFTAREEKDINFYRDEYFNKTIPDGCFVMLKESSYSAIFIGKLGDIFSSPRHVVEEFIEVIDEETINDHSVDIKVYCVVERNGSTFLMFSHGIYDKEQNINSNNAKAVLYSETSIEKQQLDMLDRRLANLKVETNEDVGATWDKKDEESVEESIATVSAMLRNS